MTVSDLYPDTASKPDVADHGEPRTTVKHEIVGGN